MSDPVTAEESQKEAVDTKPPPKKRGRKRKSEIIARKFEEIEEEIPIVESISRRGRPRRKVNYYELANPDNLDLPMQIREQERYFGAATPAASNNGAKVTENDRNGLHDTLNDNVKVENGSLDESMIEDEAGTSTSKNKDKRYNYTGATVKMMNTLFTMFSSDETKTNSTNQTNDTVDTTPNNPPKRTNRKQKEVKVEEDLDDSLGGNVVCAVCNQSIEKQLWRHHKQRFHNNLAWRVGDSPLDLSDQSLVMHTLNLLYKKKKPLYCDTCGQFKKSVVGFLSHRSQCKKSEEQLEAVKISCQVCGRRMLPVSLSTHMKALHSNPSQDVSAEKVKNNEHKPLPSKRSAAKKALKMIENVTKNDENKDKYFTSNLDFTTQEFCRDVFQNELNTSNVVECRFKCYYLAVSVDDAIKHMSECPEKPHEGYACRTCLTVSNKLEDIIFHVESVHEISVDMNDEDVNYNEKAGGVPSFLHTLIRKTERVLFPYAFEWTYKFHEENYTDLLFRDLLPKWPLLPPELAASYLPKMSESCHVARLKITSFVNVQSGNYHFRKYKLFETEQHEDNKITVFCGGPVSSLAWLPTPFQVLDAPQILAVSVQNSPDEKYSTSENYKVGGAIQFWNFGCLRNREKSMAGATMMFCLAHDHGPVWHMEWCPSGCYNLKEGTEERLGLLALTGSDGLVYIYAVPNVQEISGLFYKPKPVLKLALQRPEAPGLGNYKYYPTKISWSKALGHSHIAIGYTNGFVALFDLNSTSPILRYQDGSVTCLLPKNHFQAHSHAISALSLYHLSGGSRWLLSGSFDRGLSIWDLENHSYPICHAKKNIITDGFWFTNWLSNVTTCDEGSTTINVNALLKQARDYVNEPHISLTVSTATVAAVTGSDWLNGVIHANTMGEIVAIFPHQLFYVPEHNKIFKRKRLLFGYAALVDKTKSPEERTEMEKSKKKTLQNIAGKKLPYGLKMTKLKSDYDTNSLFADETIIYEEAEQRYGLLFCDNAMESYNDMPINTTTQLTALSKCYGVTTPNQYPLAAINKIVFNPNRQASLYYATGYQSGFLRVSWMEFLKDDCQIK